MTRQNFAECEAAADKLDSLTSMLESLVTLVRKERDHILSVARQHQNQLVPAVCLPREILETIFDFFYLGRARRSELPSEHPPVEHWLTSQRLAAKRCTLLRTCHRWNSVANRQTSLWRRLHIRRRGKVPHNDLDLILASGRMHSYSQPITFLLMDVLRPWGSINIRLFNEMSKAISQTCQTLVHVYDIECYHAHALRHGFTLPWPSLRNLLIYAGVSPDRVLELPIAPQLETLSITYREGSNVATPQVPAWYPRVVLPIPTAEKLKYLSIQCPVVNLDALLRSCPELRTLRLGRAIADFLDSASMVRLPLLEHLWTLDWDRNHRFPLQLLDCPRLQCLRVSISHLGTLSPETLSSFSPHLRVLGLEGGRTLDPTIAFLQAHPLIEQIHLPSQSDAIVLRLVNELRTSSSSQLSFLPAFQVVRFADRHEGISRVDELLGARPGPDGGGDAGAGGGGPPALRVSTKSPTLHEKYGDRVRYDPEVDWSWNMLWARCGFEE